jgi:hypothetical protein
MPSAAIHIHPFCTALMVVEPPCQSTLGPGDLDLQPPLLPTCSAWPSIGSSARRTIPGWCSSSARGLPGVSGHAAGVPIVRDPVVESWGLTVPEPAPRCRPPVPRGSSRGGRTAPAGWPMFPSRAVVNHSLVTPSCSAPSAAAPHCATHIPPLGTSQNRRGTTSIAAPRLAGRQPRARRIAQRECRK